MDKQDIQKVVHDVFIKQFKDKAEKQPQEILRETFAKVLREHAEKANTENNSSVEKKTEPKKGNMRRGKK